MKTENLSKMEPCQTNDRMEEEIHCRTLTLYSEKASDNVRKCEARKRSSRSWEKEIDLIERTREEEPERVWKIGFLLLEPTTRKGLKETYTLFIEASDSSFGVWFLIHWGYFPPNSRFWLLRLLRNLRNETHLELDFRTARLSLSNLIVVGEVQRIGFPSLASY